MESNARSATTGDFMPNEGVGQKTTGEAITSDSSSPQISDEKVQSRYLRPRVASCHDFCKYGKKQDSEADARRLNFRKFLKEKKKSAQNAKQNEVTILVAEERRIKTGTKPMTSSNVKTEFPVDTEVSNPQTSPATKNRNASGGKKTPQASVANEEGIKLKATSNIEAELPNNAEIPEPRTPPPMKNCTVSDGKKTLQTSLDNEQGRARSPNPANGNNTKASRGGTHITRIQAKTSPTCDTDTSGQPNITERKTKSSVRKPVSPVAPKVIQQKASPSILEDQQLKPKVPPPHKRVDGSGKTAITLKTKSPLIRSLSQRKSSKSLIARSNQETKVMRSPGTSKNGGCELSKPPTVSSFSQSLPSLIDQRNHGNKKVKSLAASTIGERKQLKPTVLSFSPKTHDNSSSFQLKKLRSIKRALIPHDNGLISQLRKLKSTKRNSAPHATVSGLQPIKLKGIKQTSTPIDNVSSLQPRKLRSIKRMSTPRESVSSLQTRKLWGTKQTSTFRDIVSRFQPRKLRSIKRTSSVKDIDTVGKDNTESKSGDDDLYLEMEESESAIRAMNDKEKEGNNDEDEDSEIEEKMKKSKRSTTVHTWPEDDTSTPFKLKFKRGKVISLRSDSIGARRLWFNIGRLASENPSGGGQLWRRSSRKKSSGSIDFNDPESEVQSVVLKHQGVTEKKDSKSLFNHVIEETASKLVETRKSKVKALVGAFETVISLQESKPASTA